MGQRYSFSIPDDEEELANWMDSKHEQGDFNNRSHVIRIALKRMKEDDEGSMLV